MALSRRLLRLLTAAVAIAWAVRPAEAQFPSQKPSPAEAQAMLQANPALAAQACQKIRDSGMTLDQIRTRLLASGYSASMFDACLTGMPDSTGQATTDGDQAAGLRALGLMGADSSADSSFSGMQPSGARGQFGSMRRPITSRSPLFGVDSEASDSNEQDGFAPQDQQLSPFNAARRERHSAIIGLDIFRRHTSQFDPTAAGPVDENYRVGPGDQLAIITTGGVESVHTQTIGRDGFILLPSAGQIYVANLTLRQVEDLLLTRLGRVYSGLGLGTSGTTHLAVTVTKLRTIQVFVIGDVEDPGSYRMSSAGTILTALYAAGGPTDSGSVRQVQVRRDGQVVGSLDLYDYVMRGDESHDLSLQNGDVVFVPHAAKRVELTGPVRRGIYELLPSEKLPDLLRMAGGLGPNASRDRIQIERTLPPDQRAGNGRDRLVMDLTSPDLSTGNGPNVDLQDQDIIRVFPISRHLADRIDVRGDVWQPGALGFTPGMKLSEAIARAGGVKSDVYLGQIIVSRLQSDSSRKLIRTAFRDTTGALTHDLTLEDADDIQVFSVSDFRSQRFVSITGAVGYPGRFPYREGMTLRDLLIMAGGFRDGALLTSAEVARLPADRRGGVTAVTISVPLDSSYLFGVQPGVPNTPPPGMNLPTGHAPDFPLKPYDNVLILRQEDWGLARQVWITGEVRYPGKYTLTSRTERLADLVRQAGGLTGQAYADGVGFYRGPLKARVGVDLAQVLDDSTFRDNLILADGDSVNVPVFNAIVRVQGAVNAPMFVTYSPGANADYYVRAAGGYSQRGDPDAVFVTQANGKVESVSRHVIWFDHVPVPQPGSIVTVPQRVDNGRDWTQAAGPVASALASIVALIVLVKR